MDTNYMNKCIAITGPTTSGKSTKVQEILRNFIENNLYKSIYVLTSTAHKFYNDIPKVTVRTDVNFPINTYTVLVLENDFPNVDIIRPIYLNYCKDVHATFITTGETSFDTTGYDVVVKLPNV
jgi:deoxyadenosine/deoxycytidine kinase